MLNDTATAALCVKRTIYKAKRSVWQRSLRLLNPVITFSDQNEDDFVRNLVTIRVDFDAYKMPRIVKRMLTKKL